MEQMRDILRSVLARSLSQLSPLDRLATAWPVAAGSAIAERSSVIALNGTVAIIQVADPAWLKQLRTMTPRLRTQLERIAGVPLTDILFERAEPMPPISAGTQTPSAAITSAKPSRPRLNPKGTGK